MAHDAVERSVSLATSMSLAALQNYAKKLGGSRQLSLQSVVLSGRACALPTVQEQLRRKLRDLNVSIENPRQLFAD